jgi:hypothetical protein
MSKYIITIDVGFGKESQIIEAESQAEADEAAQQEFQQECESQHSYEAEPYTKKLAIELELESEEIDG